MENFQTKIREIIYEQFFIIYKKCLKLTLNSDKTLIVKFNNNLALELLDENFIKELSNKIENILNLKNNINISKIIKYHFDNIKIKEIGGKYKLKSDHKEFTELINPIKWNILNKFYQYLELNKLENNIFNILHFNEFIYYHLRYSNRFSQPLGYLIILVFIIFLIDN